MAPQKRSANETYSQFKDCEMILMDVEGTTTPTKFVTETMFPYVKDHVKTYITKHFDEEECQSVISALRTLAEEDKTKETDGLVEIPVTDDKDALIKAIVGNVTWQMSQDRKSTALKQLQGHVLKEAFKQGAIKAPMYDDVVPFLKKLCSDQKKVCVFSSGSVETQKLLFGHTDDGDLRENITDYYDTTMGSKKEAESYTKIAEESGVSVDKIVYFTDTPQEARAAVTAGMKVHLLVRPDNGPHPAAEKKDLSCIESFDELFSNNQGSKKPATDNDKVGAGGDANGSTPADEFDDEDGENDDVDVNEEEGAGDEGHNVSD